MKVANIFATDHYFSFQKYLLQKNFKKKQNEHEKNKIMNQVMKVSVEEIITPGIATIVKMDMNIMKAII